MSDVKVSGKVIEVGTTETVGTGVFRKRLLVVETEDQYPQQLPIEFVQDKVDLLNPISVGKSVDVFINLRGRGWTNKAGVTKYFPSFQGWRIEASTATASKTVAAENTDDLPF
jgi:hypothetical protein